jgi:hypothetical protein
MVEHVEVDTWVAFVGPLEPHKLQIHDCTQQVSELLRTWALVKQDAECCSCSPASKSGLNPTKAAVLIDLAMAAAAVRSEDPWVGFAHTQPALFGAVLGVAHVVVVRLQWRHKLLADLELAGH